MGESRALLLTDLVDSTRLSESLGEAGMAALWSAHDRVARDLLRAWRGREIDKSDGFLHLFASAADAAGYALSYHRALAELAPPLGARAGIHLGPVILRENSPADVALGAKSLEVDGLAKSIAARVMSAARGGQTLLTAEAMQGLGTTDLRVQSHGHWHLKGIPEAVELFEIGDEESPFEPPPDSAKAYRVVRQGDLWLPARQIKHSLPAERDTFVGRRESLLELARRVDEGARLVSVLGIGGSGKTRLAARFAWTRLGDFPGGAWFCDLSAARSLDGIVHAVAQSLDVPLGKDDPVVQLANAIAGRGRCLVILDNFEQVSQFAEETLGRWLDRARGAIFIATTRDVLGLAGEQVLVLPPLHASDAQALFARRAESARQRLCPTAEDEEAIARLVKLLDGLPLAIELAAARTRVMSPKALLARMSERFRLLASTGGRRDRQATLRSTFDWSWELLSTADKAALAQLSVFEGGFTLESAEAVLDLSSYDEAEWPIAAVQSLADKSFVQQAAGERLQLLVSVQEYASEHLRTEGRFPGSGAGASRAAELRHMNHFARLGAQGAVADACAEIDNLIVACRRAAARGLAAQAVAALEGAWAALQLRGPLRVATELAALVRCVPGLEPALLAAVENVTGHALRMSGSGAQARRHLETALGLAQGIGDQRCAAEALSELGWLADNEGREEEAYARFEAALPLAVAAADPVLQCAALTGLGSVAEVRGNMDDANTHFRAALAVARASGDRRREGRTLGNLGLVAMELGRMEEGLGLYEAALAMSREAGDRGWEGNTLCNLGILHLFEGRMPEARADLEGALVLARETGHPRLESVVLCNLGIVEQSSNRHDDARAHFEAAIGMARELRDQRSEGQFLGYLALVHAHQGNFREARACLDRGRELLHATGDPLSIGILECSRAETEHLAGETLAAAAALAEARALAGQVGAGPKSELGLAIDRVSRLRAASEAHQPLGADTPRG